MRSYFYLIDMRVFRSSPPFFFGLLFDPHAHAYNPFNSQRYTLMAEDAVESAGAKAPAITIDRETAELSAHDRLPPTAKKHIDSANNHKNN